MGLDHANAVRTPGKTKARGGCEKMGAGEEDDGKGNIKFYVE